jgi:hypothetical protein
MTVYRSFEEALGAPAKPSDSEPESWKRTKERFKNRNELTDKLGFSGTPLGRRVTADIFIKDLANLLAGEHSTARPAPVPRGFKKLMDRVGPETLALAALHALLTGIYRGWDRKDQSAGQARKIKQAIGDYVCQVLAQKDMLDLPNERRRKIAKQIGKTKRGGWMLRSYWTPPKKVRLGHWLLCEAMRLEFFTQDEDGFPSIQPDWQAEIDKIYEEMVWIDPVILPLFEPPPDWTGWVTNYDGRLERTFVRDWRPATQVRIEAAFAEHKKFIESGGEQGREFLHATAVSAHQRVPLLIDQTIAALVERFAVEVMEHSGKKRKDDERLVKADLRDAKYIGERQFYLPHDCDKRGRIYPIPHLNYQREDHVRGMIRFAKGIKLGPEGIRWLEIHCANCEGSTDKEPWDVRHKWVHKNRRDILAIAARPNDTFELWRKASSPFCYVAACIELAEAWKNPTKFVTHLPIAFDGSANGIQHLAIISGDIEVAKMVNLVATPEAMAKELRTQRRRKPWSLEQISKQLAAAGYVASDGKPYAPDAIEKMLDQKSEIDRPQDVYQHIINRVKRVLTTDENKSASWWLDRFEILDDKKIRKIIKTPAMTFAYNVTVFGMSEKIVEECLEICNRRQTNDPEMLSLGLEIEKAKREARPTGEKWFPQRITYLAKKVREACRHLLPGPATVMDYVSKFTKHCTDKERLVQLTSPSLFPWSNHYYEPNVERVYLIENGVEVKHKVADGETTKIKKRKARNSAAPNLVHSLDAAHLALTVVQAVRDGITNILAVHDSYVCLAPQAIEFNKIIRSQLMLMYLSYDPLRRLYAANVQDGEIFDPLPRYGGLNLWELQNTEWSFS